MGVITDLENRVNTLVESSDIATATYDRLDAINEDAENNYPMCIYRVTGTTNNNTRNTKQYFELTVDFYLSDIYYSGDTETIPEKLDYVDELLLELVTSIPDYGTDPRGNNFELLGGSSAEYGWNENNDDAVMVKRTVTIRAFKCIERI